MIIIRTILGLWLPLCLLTTPVLHAKQLQFQRAYDATDAILSYTWLNHAQERQRVTFRLPQKELQQGNSEFQSFSNKAMMAHTTQALQTFATAQSVGRKSLIVTPQANKIQFNFLGYSPDEVNNLQSQMQTIKTNAEEDFLRQTFYTRFDNRVMPDHRRIAKRYIAAMRPVATAMASNMPASGHRAQINYLLSFLQSLPYDQLLNRQTSNGAGFQTPYGLLLNNRGDCDTKSVALAALLRNFFPNMRLLIVYVPGHAFVGIKQLPTQGDKAIKVAGETFVLADPTGPRQLKLGEVDPDALGYLRQRQYSYQEVPF